MLVTTIAQEDRVRQVRAMGKSAEIPFSLKHADPHFQRLIQHANLSFPDRVLKYISYLSLSKYQSFYILI